MNNWMTSPGRPVDLNNCEREPIHIPGSIQPHGALLAVDPVSLCIQQWSANVPSILNLNEDQLPARHLRDLLDATSMVRLERLVDKNVSAVMTPLQITFSRLHESGYHLGTAHLYDGVLLVEFEVRCTQQVLLHSTVEEGTESITRCVQQATARLHASANLGELYEVLATEVRRLSGFDRVMIYQFMPDNHGIVVGESLQPELEPYLGLHYPSTDIPPQARRLYTLNTLRVIVDVNAEAVPLEPEHCPVHGRPLDLTYSSFRSVSPIHIEYLQNMGVAASMSISIISNGELWGLIACHHYQARNISLEIRAACELLGTMAGGYVTNRQISDDIDARKERQEILGLATRKLAGIDSIRDGLRSIHHYLQQSVDAQGVAVCWQDEVMLFGDTPPMDFVSSLHQYLASEMDSTIWCTDQLSSVYIPATDYVEVASGIMVLHLGMEPREMLIFFRPQYVREVNWAGNPEKTTVITEAGTRLSPRKSFAQWTQTVRYQSRPWSRLDQDMCVDMHAALLRILAQRSAELIRMNEELVRINTDLDTFAYAASHDLKEPLRTINQTLFFLERALAAQDSEEIQRRITTIQKTTERMTDLLEGLLRVSRAGSSDLHIEWIDLHDVVNDAAEIALGSRHPVDIELTIHPMPAVAADFMCLRDVFQNLFSNARKYSQRAFKHIEVGVIDVLPEMDPPRQALGKPAIYVRDDGIGIARERLIDVFQVFRRLHQVGEYGGGSGVGLAIVKRIVERHGGVVWANSEPNSGTTFYFTLEALCHGE